MGLSQGYGPADEDTSIRTIHAALDAGITLFDTAMSYGQGHNETLVGQALRDPLRLRSPLSRGSCAARTQWSSTATRTGSATTAEPL